MKNDEFDVVGFIIAYENGDVDWERLIKGFQHLLDSGIVWKLQGNYQRMAHRLIEAGHITEEDGV